MILRLLKTLGDDSLIYHKLHELVSIQKLGFLLKITCLAKLKERRLKACEKNIRSHPAKAGFRGLIFEHNAACPAIAASDGGRLAK